MSIGAPKWEPPPLRMLVLVGLAGIVAGLGAFTLVYA